MKFIIYNQWGLKVFETDNQQRGWDGTYNGKVQQEGNYIYSLDGILENDEKIFLSDEKE